MEIEHVHQRAALGGLFGGHLVEQPFVVVQLARLIAAGVRRRRDAPRGVLQGGKIVPAVADAAENQSIGVHVLDGGRVGDGLVAHLRKRRCVGVNQRMGASAGTGLNHRPAGRVARLPARRQRFAPQARFVVKAVKNLLVGLPRRLHPIHELVGEHVAVALIGSQREGGARVDGVLLGRDLMPTRRRRRLTLVHRAVGVGRDVTGHRHGHDKRPVVVRCRFQRPAHRFAGRSIPLAPDEIVVAVVIPIGTGIGRVGLPVVARPTIAAEPVERDRIGKRRSRKEVHAVDIRRDWFRARCRVHRKPHVRRPGIIGRDGAGGGDGGDSE